MGVAPFFFFFYSRTFAGWEIFGRAAGFRKFIGSRSVVFEFIYI